MNFYSTYFKSHATNAQTKKMKEIFDRLDGGGVPAQADKALNADELANIFTDQTFTDKEKTMLLSGFDMDDDGFLTYNEFSKAFLEFDIDDSTEVTTNEGLLIKTKLDELNKENEILTQYGIINSFSSTASEKAKAKEKVDLLKAERLVLNSDNKIQEKQILISNNETKAEEIENYVESSTLLEFEKAQKLKEAQVLRNENDILTLELNILTAERETRNIDKEIIANEQALKTETDSDKVVELTVKGNILQVQKIEAASKLTIAENNLKIFNTNQQLEADQKLLTKFYIPEIYKENARKRIEEYTDQNQLLQQENEAYDKVNQYAEKGINILITSYNYYVAGDKEAGCQALQEFMEKEPIWKAEALIAGYKSEIYKRQIELKAVESKTNQGSAFVKKKAKLEAEIVALQNEIAILEANFNI